MTHTWSANLYSAAILIAISENCKTIDKAMASLSTCHLRFALDNNLVESSEIVITF